MLLRHKIFRLALLSLSFCLCACEFRPLYVGQSTYSAISGEKLVEETALIFIDEIPDRSGQILRRALKNGLSPKSEAVNPKYRLQVRISDISISEQGLRLDDLATRYVMRYTATYFLYTYPENKNILEDKTIARVSYDVQVSPYATEVAEQAATQRAMKILGEDISLRLAAFLKSYNLSSEKTIQDSNVVSPVQSVPVIEEVFIIQEGGL